MLLTFDAELFESEQEDDPTVSAFFIPKHIVNTMRQKGKMYFDFATYFIGPVVGKQNYKDKNRKYRFSRYVTATDEAFALLVFENNYNRWLSMALSNDWTTSSVKPEYTTGGNINQTPKNVKTSSTPKKGKLSAKNNNVDGTEVVNNDSSTSMYQGWSVAGIQRFNVLLKLVKKERAGPLGSRFEKEYLQYCINKKDGKNRKVTRKAIVYEACSHDLWQDDVITDDADLNSEEENIVGESNDGSECESESGKESESSDIDNSHEKDVKEDAESDDDNSSSVGLKQVTGVEV